MSSLKSSECESVNADLSEKCSNIALDSSGEIINSSYRLQTSHCSTISNDSELSSLSLYLDKELDCHSSNIDNDELPAFEIRLISPLGRSPSPIDSEGMETPTRSQNNGRLVCNLFPNNSEYVALQDINAQISPPSDHSDQLEDDACLSRTSSLETIFEGVFLNTPPRHRINLENPRRCRSSLLEKVALKRLNIGKENKSPSAPQEDSLPTRRRSLDLKTVKNLENGFS